MKYIIFNVNYRRLRKIFINKIKKVDVMNLKMCRRVIFIFITIII